MVTVGYYRGKYVFQNEISFETTSIKTRQVVPGRAAKTQFASHCDNFVLVLKTARNSLILWTALIFNTRWNTQFPNMDPDPTPRSSKSPFSPGPHQSEQYGVQQYPGQV
ncbi:hypothetical protein EVAR_70939_1 [Eumeta japonica]|uniref:Uncharacterized protein n=1 Tax=Eumeta variegata TaxID=151549 RepID=A0A4C2A6C9_EUMVA|nr:hypothetical protein EVAR_70939_1 [Eumeta japonica]